MEDMVTLQPREGCCILFHMHQSYWAEFDIKKNCRESIQKLIKTGAMLQQVGEVSTTIINMKLTEKLINPFMSFHDSLRTLESKFLNHMLKRNPIHDKLFWRSYQMFVSWPSNCYHFVGKVMRVIPNLHSCTFSARRTT